MKKILLGLVAAMFTSTSVHAQNEDLVLITEDTQGNRFLFDRNSFNIVKDDAGAPVLYAVVRQFTPGTGMGPRLHLLTHAKNCEKNEGEIYHRAIINGSWQTINTWWWSIRNDRVYDHVAIFMCGYLKGMLQKLQEQQNKPKQNSSRLNSSI